MSITEKLAADTVAEFPEITDPAQQLRLRDHLIRAYRFCANSDNAMSPGDAAAWDAGHPGMETLNARRD